jgi:pimeloyl-ACP methyl ester carboxylesterase
MPGVFLTEGYIEALKQITAPTSLVYGSDSWYQFPDLPDREAAISNRRRHEIPGSHSLHIDSPDSLADLLLRDLKEALE